MALGSNYVSGLISKYKIGDATGEELRHKFLMALNANAANASRMLELGAANASRTLELGAANASRTLELGDAKRTMQYGGGLSNAIVRALHLKSEDDIPRAIFQNSAFNPTRAEIREAIGDVFPQKPLDMRSSKLRHASNVRKTLRHASNVLLRHASNVLLRHASNMRKTRRQFILPTH
jgi:hypothetical protein